jgi:hypothetical protein
MPTLEEILLAKRDVERRTLPRTRINRSALLFFPGLSGVHSCRIRDVTNQGAGIRLERLNIVPSEFQVSFDNFRTIGNCRLIWRDGNLVGVSWTPDRMTIPANRVASLSYFPDRR